MQMVPPAGDSTATSGAGGGVSTRKSAMSAVGGAARGLSVGMSSLLRAVVLEGVRLGVALSSGTQVSV